MAVLLAAGIGAVTSLFGSNKASKQQKAAQAQQAQQFERSQQMQREQMAMQREAIDFQRDVTNRQLGFAQDQRDWLRNTIRPELTQTQQALQTNADRYANQFDAQANEAIQRGNTFFNRAEQYVPALNDRLYGLINNTGDMTYATEAANRASADVSQSYFKGIQANTRNARAYGADLNKLMAAQEDNAANFALAQATAMDKARNAARQLNINMVSGGIDQFSKNYALADNSTRLGLQTGQAAMGMRSTPAQYALQSAQIQSGIAGNVGSLYNGAGAIGNSMLSSATSSVNNALNAGNDLTRMSFGNAANLNNAATLNNAGLGQFIGQNARALPNFFGPSQSDPNNVPVIQTDASLASYYPNAGLDDNLN